MRFYIDTVGCPKNFADSESLAGLLERAGHSRTARLEQADLLILNTCGFIQDAKTESIDRIFDLIETRPEGAKLVVAGCLTQRYSVELFAEIPEIDLLMGVSDFDRLPAHLASGAIHERGRLGVGQAPPHYPEWGKPSILGAAQSRFLKIADGCDNRCAYCVIPSIRGSYRSRTIEALVAEARAMAEDGCLELNLVAQDVTAYGSDLYGGRRLCELIRKLSEIPEIAWIRLLYCYEDRMDDELIDLFRENPKLCRYVDMPIQHINGELLARMNRRSTRESILATIAKLRKRAPGIHLRTALITGLPGETEAMFEELADFVSTARFERLGVFAYSEEEGTLAAAMTDQVPMELRRERRDFLMNIQREIALDQNRSKVGQVLTVLTEAAEEPGVFRGRTAFDAPEIDDEVLFRSDRRTRASGFAKVRITDAYDYDLIGVEEEVEHESAE